MHVHSLTTVIHDHSFQLSLNFIVLKKLVLIHILLVIYAVSLLSVVVSGSHWVTLQSRGTRKRSCQHRTGNEERERDNFTKIMHMRETFTKTMYMRHFYWTTL